MKKGKGISARGWFYGQSFHSIRRESEAPVPAVPVPKWRADFVCPDCRCNTCDGAGFCIMCGAGDPPEGE